MKAAQPVLPAHKRRGSLFRTIKAVLWSFVGLRGRGDYERDVEQLNPVHIVVVALVGIVIFVGGLIFLATWAVGK
jgi:Protein of unknown function (DUF2970)